MLLTTRVNEMEVAESSLDFLLISLVEAFSGQERDLSYAKIEGKDTLKGTLQEWDIVWDWLWLNGIHYDQRFDTEYYLDPPVERTEFYCAVPNSVVFYRIFLECHEYPSHIHILQRFLSSLTCII